MRLSKILNGINLKSGVKLIDVNIDNITDDSRKVRPGSLFIAVKGHSVDASGFIGAAIKSGAKAIMSQRDFKAPSGVVKILVGDARAAASTIAANFNGRPSSKLKTVGITGTNGKTTITYLLEGIIKASGAETGVIGTINYRFNGNELPAVNTTPGPLVLQGMLAEMVRQDIDYAVMEVSSHSLDQGRVDDVLFDVGIFTNLTGDHMDYHKTPTKYFKAKKKLFDKLKKNGFAILNGDDKKVASLKGSIKGSVITYGIKHASDVIANDIELSMNGSGFTVSAPGAKFKIQTRLIGIHNVSNILAAVAAALALKIPKESIVKGVESVMRVPGRLESVEARQPFKVFVDFAHTEDALFNVLSLLRGVAEKRIVTVFGCGGDRDKTKRPRMGKVACEYSDHVIVTSDNPRSEDPGVIIGEIESGIKSRFANYDIVPDRREAISKALGRAESGDIVVIAGKGHEDYQIIGDKYTPFDDREVALSILKKYSGE